MPFEAHRYAFEGRAMGVPARVARTRGRVCIALPYAVSCVAPRACDIARRAGRLCEQYRCAHASIWCVAARVRPAERASQVAPIPAARGLGGDRAVAPPAWHAFR
ncbi:hypothetical protein D7S86_22040 [Pararobbsia silviterrae]|uniref:Uncharacterized protein n=1 Tax=Pararobbsia silviterrae TaxID=1792498 RepID=A0A494XFN7_9BURK|nr:hypothetical protein D7S86_22040 [Pararobbsia silviterrae]